MREHRGPGQSLCLAAVLADQNAGTLTTFHAAAGSEPDPVKERAVALGLDKWISPIQSGRSYTWAMQRLLNTGDRHSFDVCVLNGNKTWDAGGLGAVMADMMLRPGGLMILCGINWSMAGSPYFQSRPQITQKYAPDELRAFPVQLVMDQLLPHLGYEILDTPTARSFGFARKL